MPAKTEYPEWYVYIEDVNAKEIKKYNVFRSYNFLEGCKKAFKKYNKPEQIEDLEKEVRSWAMYSFWSKCEYEIILSSWPEREDFNEEKIDVYDQLCLNWNSFFKYTYEHKAFFLRREKK